MLLVLSIGQVFAKDYWVYTDNSGDKFYITAEQSDFRPGYGDKHATMKIVRPNGDFIIDRWNFSYDEGEWYYGQRGKKGSSYLVRKYPHAQATLNFGLAHWTRNGFVE